MSEMGVRRDKAALSSGCKSHPANAPAGSSQSSYGGDEIAEAFGKLVLQVKMKSSPLSLSILAMGWQAKMSSPR
jgi:hypothetical protein